MHAKESYDSAKNKDLSKTKLQARQTACIL